MADDQHPADFKASLSFSPEALAEKYRIEREKRLRPEGMEQYVDLGKVFTNYVEDPHVEPGFTRDPIEADADVLVVGAGFSGMLTAVHLRMAGVEDVRIVEKAGDFGGTWYWNRYPGAACDTESYIYMPLLEETGYMPTQRYTTQPEIWDHCLRIARQYDLYRGAIFQTGVTGVRWQADRQRWLVETDRQDRLHARFVVLAGGLLHKPKLPKLPGMETFKGHSFHTSRWDYDYTGGSVDGGLTGLADKRVGIIGTGATAIQSVPHLAEGAKHLYVFQRTPSGVDLRNNRPTDPEWVKTLKPGWQRRRMMNFTNVVSGVPQDEDLVNDGWTKSFRTMQQAPPELASDPVKAAEYSQLADFRQMEEIRARVDEIVKDPKTAAALKPYYNRMCKRPGFHDHYLPAFNRPNVTLVDTDGRGVERITEKGVVANGVEYEIDCLIYATGFEFGTDYIRRLGFDVEGRDGRLLSGKLAEAFGSLHGMTTRGFPNLLIISVMQANGTANFPHMLGEQAKHAAYLASRALQRGVTSMEPSEAAEEAWLREILGGDNAFARFMAACTPSYFNNEGQLEMTPAAARRGGFPGGTEKFIQILEAWRAADDFAGLEVRKQT
jgi:cation diffusion facilitator CzcD-associated flavoprotein CzcO